MKNRLNAFTLMEMMVVMVILTIILAASTPLITRRAARRPDVVYKVVTIQTPVQTQQVSQQDATLNNVAQNDSSKILDAQNKIPLSKNTQDKIPLSQNQTKSENKSVQADILSQDVANIETITDKYGNPQTLVTLTSGKKVIVSSDEKGQPIMKVYNK